MAFVFRAFAGSAQTLRGCRVGVFLDYCALPQKRRNGNDDRSAEDHARFRRALRGINSWYGHKRTHVLLVNTPEVMSFAELALIGLDLALSAYPQSEG